VEELMRKADLNMLPKPDLLAGTTMEVTGFEPRGVLGVDSFTVCCVFVIDLHAVMRRCINSAMIDFRK
jgi:hypothetical protein